MSGNDSDEYRVKLTAYLTLYPAPAARVHECEPREPHLCPYKEEISDDHTTECTCCRECEAECSGDI